LFGCNERVVAAACRGGAKAVRSYLRGVQPEAMMRTSDYEFSEAAGTGAGAPALFLFHGTGGDEHQFFDLAAELLPGARRIAPRGDVSENGALRYFKRHAEGRFDMPDLARATDKMAAFVRDRVAAERSGKTVGFGYSNGANILAAVQFKEPELFDVAVLLHPMIPFDPGAQEGLRGKRVLITAGRNDAICPAPTTQRLADWYEAQGAETTLFWHGGGHEIRQDELGAIRDYLAKL
jgi:phospholipase/carboxylesterase